MAHALTFQDVMQLYESGGVAPYVDLQDASFVKTMISTGTSGAWNAIYGAQAWYQLNTEANLFGILPKLTWDKSGMRSIAAFTRNTSTLIAMTETGTLPTPTAPTITTIKFTPKIAANTFETTQVVEQLAKLSQDDMFANLDTIRMFYATEHVKLLNQQMNLLAVGTTAATSTVNVSGGVGGTPITFESIDRIVSSFAEGTIVTGYAASNSTLKAVINPWNSAIDRSAAASAYDSVVQSPSGTINTPAFLTDSAVRTLIQGARTNGAFSNVFVTGYNTYAEIQGLYLSNWRTANWGELKVSPGLNGIHASEGLDTGVKVGSMYGLPVIQAVDTPASQGTVGVQNLYLLDTTDTEGYGDARLGAQILNPTNYLETSARDFILLGALAYQGLYMTIGEHVCRFLGAQAKLRDIN